MLSTLRDFHMATLSMMLIFNALAGIHGDIVPTDYILPDGTSITFGNISTFIDSGINSVTDLQVDQYIPGNLLAVSDAALRTVNDSGATIVVGHGTFTGYVNGYGTAARVDYPAVYQLTPEILLLAEYNNHCVRLLNRTDNNYVTDFVGSCTSSGYVDGVGTSARLEYPTRLLGHPVDPNLVFVSEDSSGNIRLINVTSVSVTTYMRSAFTSLTSIVWDPYYCNTLLVTDDYSFKRLQIDTFTLTTYGNASGYVDGSLHLAQYKYLWDAKVIYKDLYAVVDNTDHRVRIIDTASCVAFSICAGYANTTDGPLDQCTVYQPSSLLFTSGVLYIGGTGYINALPINVGASGSLASSCAPISTESTRNESAFVDEAPCQQLPSTTTSITSTTTTTTAPTTTTTTTTPTTTTTTTTPTTTTTSLAPTTTTTATVVTTTTTSLTSTVGASNSVTAAATNFSTTPLHTGTTNLSTTPVSTGTTSSSTSLSAGTTNSSTTLQPKGYTCAVGTPNNYAYGSCAEGCFGLYINREISIGCLADLNVSYYGFAQTSVCGEDEQNGKCVTFSTESEDVINCIRCCTDAAICNYYFSHQCDYDPSDSRCNSCAVLTISVIFLVLCALVPYI